MIINKIKKFVRKVIEKVTPEKHPEIDMGNIDDYFDYIEKPEGPMHRVFEGYILDEYKEHAKAFLYELSSTPQVTSFMLAPGFQCITIPGEMYILNFKLSKEEIVAQEEAQKLNQLMQIGYIENQNNLYQNSLALRQKKITYDMYPKSYQHYLPILITSIDLVAEFRKNVKSLCGNVFFESSEVMGIPLLFVKWTDENIGPITKSWYIEAISDSLKDTPQD